MKKNQVFFTISIIVNIVLIISVLYILQHDNMNSTNQNHNNSSLHDSNISKEMHNHTDKLVNPETDTIPTINTKVFVDAKDGFNIQILTENFDFTPENASANLDLVNAGHAHLYINDQKVTRIYSDWIYIPSKWLNQPLNNIKIVLNTDSHKELHLGKESIRSEFYLVFDAKNIDKKSVSLEEFRYLSSTNPDYIILDVRTKDEFDQGHIKDSINISLTDADFITKINNLDKSETYLVYCRSGNRSLEAFKIMQENGFTNLYNAREGISSWVSKSFPIEK